MRKDEGDRIWRDEGLKDGGHALWGNDDKGSFYRALAGYVVELANEGFEIEYNDSQADEAN
jgi:hypothetical protein